MRYLRYVWYRYFWRGPCTYTETVLEDGLTQYQRDLCLYRRKKQ